MTQVQVERFIKSRTVQLVSKFECISQYIT